MWVAPVMVGVGVLGTVVAVAVGVDVAVDIAVGVLVGVFVGVGVAVSSGVENAQSRVVSVPLVIVTTSVCGGKLVTRAVRVYSPLGKDVVYAPVAVAVRTSIGLLRVSVAVTGAPPSTVTRPFNVGWIAARASTRP